MPLRRTDAVDALVRESVAAVDALTPQAMRAVTPALAAARDELQRELNDWLGNARNGGERFTAHAKTSAIRALEGALERVEELEPAMAAGLRTMRKVAGPLAVENFEREHERLHAIFGHDLPVLPSIDRAAIHATGEHALHKRHANAARIYANGVGDDINRQLAIGVAKGESIDQLATRIRKLGNPAAHARPLDAGRDAGEMADALFRRHRYWAERLVRTETMNAYNVLHDESIRYANEHRLEGDEEMLRRWSAAADKRACERCRRMDGRTARIDEPFPGGVMRPPLHPHCRCTVVAWMQHWGDAAGETPPANTTAPTPRQPAPTRDGQRIGMDRVGVEDVAPVQSSSPLDRLQRRPAIRESEIGEGLDWAELRRQAAARELREQAELKQAIADAVRKAAEPVGTTSVWRPGDERFRERERRQEEDLRRAASLKISQQEIYEAEVKRDRERQAQRAAAAQRAREIGDREREDNLRKRREAEQQAALRKAASALPGGGITGDFDASSSGKRVDKLPTAVVQDAEKRYRWRWWPFRKR